MRTTSSLVWVVSALTIAGTAQAGTKNTQETKTTVEENCGAGAHCDFGGSPGTTQGPSSQSGPKVNLSPTLSIPPPIPRRSLGELFKRVPVKAGTPSKLSGSMCYPEQWAN